MLFLLVLIDYKNGKNYHRIGLNQCLFQSRENLFDPDGYR